MPAPPPSADDASLGPSARRPPAHALRSAAAALALSTVAALSSPALAAPTAEPASVKSPVRPDAPPAISTGSTGAQEPKKEPALAPTTRTIGLDEIKQGMTGFGLTVFQGTRPERFPVKVIGVLRKFLPQQDIVLIECDDPRLKHSGIVAGMSGSPIYIDTPDGPRLAGALAYGWHFAKDPIAGVTPIANMLAEMRRPLRGREKTPVAEAALDPRHRLPGLSPSGPSSENQQIAASQDPDAASQNRDRTDRTAALLDPSSLRPVSVPLAVSGFTPQSFDELKKVLEPWGITALAAGGGGPPPGSAGTHAPAHFEPGDAISVQLVRGDMSAAGTGTVTYVEGDKVVAFGHPMFNVGEIYLPIATAEVHTVLASLSSSFKLASPLVEAGTLEQDRQSCIVGSTSGHTDMIPVNVTINTAGTPSRQFHAEVIRHRFLTPMLASLVIGNALQSNVSDVADATVAVRTSLGVKGQKPLELTDHTFSVDGVSSRALAGMSGMRAISDLLFNPFAPANLERVDVQIDIEYRADIAEITGATLSTDSIEPGSRPSLRVTLRPYNGAEYTEVVPITIPATLSGSMVKIEVAAGSQVKPPQAAPERFEQLLDNLRKSYPARSLVVTLQAPDEALALRGSVISDLPASVLDTLRPGASTRRGETFKVADRVVQPVRLVVVGKQELQVKVKEEPLR